jgi:hypothetical protein
LDVLPRLDEWEMRMELLVAKERELHLTLEAQLAHALNSRRREAQKPETSSPTPIFVLCTPSPASFSSSSLSITSKSYLPTIRLFHVSSSRFQRN